jgi:hypothetical protein
VLVDNWSLGDKIDGSSIPSSDNYVHHVKSGQIIWSAPRKIFVIDLIIRGLGILIQEGPKLIQEVLEIILTYLIPLRYIIDFACIIDYA